MFKFDSRLTADSYYLGDFSLCALLLSKDANYPWFILVPRIEDITEIYQLGTMFRADIADISQKSITMGVKGDPEKIDDFIELLRPYGIKDLMRSGRVSLLKE